MRCDVCGTYSSYTAELIDGREVCNQCLALCDICDECLRYLPVTEVITETGILKKFCEDCLAKSKDGIRNPLASYMKEVVNRIRKREDFVDCVVIGSNPLEKGK